MAEFDGNYYNDEMFEIRHPDDVMVLQRFFRQGMLSNSAKSMINQARRKLGKSWGVQDIEEWISMEKKMISALGGLKERVLERALRWSLLPANKDPPYNQDSAWCDWNVFAAEIRKEYGHVENIRKASSSDITTLRKWFKRGFISTGWNKKGIAYLYEVERLDPLFWDVKRIRLWLTAERRDIEIHGGAEADVLKLLDKWGVGHRSLDFENPMAWFPWQEHMATFSDSSDSDHDTARNKSATAMAVKNEQRLQISSATTHNQTRPTKSLKEKSEGVNGGDGARPVQKIAAVKSDTVARLPSPPKIPRSRGVPRHAGVVEGHGPTSSAAVKVIPSILPAPINQAIPIQLSNPDSSVLEPVAQPQTVTAQQPKQKEKKKKKRLSISTRKLKKIVEMASGSTRSVGVGSGGVTLSIHFSEGSNNMVKRLLRKIGRVLESREEREERREKQKQRLERQGKVVVVS